MRLTELVTPLKPLEAMAQGQLFVASDVGGHKELIKHNQTGILFKAGSKSALAEAILNLLANRQRWPELKANGRSFVEEIRNWRNSVANYVRPTPRSPTSKKPEPLASSRPHRSHASPDKNPALLDAFSQLGAARCTAFSLRRGCANC